MYTSQEKTTGNRFFSLTPLAILIIAGILFFGLWPHSWPTLNDAHLRQSEHTLRLHGSGIVYTEKSLFFDGRTSHDDFTIHLSLAPETIQKKGFKPIFVFNNGDNKTQLAIWHWGPSLIVMNGDDYNYARKWPRISAINSLKAKESTFLSITTEKNATRLFINGVIVQESKELKLSIPSGKDQPRLIFGNSVYGNHGWAGDLHYFTLHDKAFSKEEVLLYYNWWAAGNRPPPAPIGDAQLLYTFNTIEKHLIPDLSGHDIPLHVPAKVTVFKRAFLAIPPYNFKPNRLFWTDAILNLIGFIPLGAIVCGWLHQKSTLHRRKKMYFSLAFCFAISLVMEIIQGWLPHRFSSLQDLILNTVGAALGIVLMSWIVGTKNMATVR